MKKLFSLLCAMLFCGICAVSGFAAEKVAPTAKPAEAAKSAVAEKKTAVQSAVKEELIDINTATEEQLKMVPGIGDTYAKKIIAGRPYAKKDQLVSRNIVPKAVYDKVKEKIIAKQAKK